VPPFSDDWTGCDCKINWLDLDEGQKFGAALQLRVGVLFRWATQEPSAAS
jgi:hypothetical protein